jgi:hypothetical protein
MSLIRWNGFVCCDVHCLSQAGDSRNRIVGATCRRFRMDAFTMMLSNPVQVGNKTHFCYLT